MTTNVKSPIKKDPQATRRAVVAASAGTVLEWYEYGLFGVASSLVIGPLFFTPAGQAGGTLLAFGTFAAGFFARPIGGLILGPLGDRMGRRPVLLICVTIIGIATALIGLLPTFAQIGIWAPILLVIVRILQGLGSGAEMAGAFIYMNESAQPGRRGRSASWTMSAALLGSALGIVMFTVLSNVIPEPEFLAWGWRIPFLLAVPFTVAALLLRRRLPESPEFESISREKRVSMLEAAKLAFAASPRNFVAAFLVPTGLLVTGYVIFIFSLTYVVKNVGLTPSEGLLITLSVQVFGSYAILACGRLTDRFGAKRVLVVGAVSTVILVVPYVLSFSTGNVWIIAVASVLVYTAGAGTGSGAHTVFMPALFPTEYRSSGVTISRELSTALLGGTAPLVTQALLGATGSIWVVVAVIGIAVIFTLSGALLGRPIVSPETE